MPRFALVCCAIAVLCVSAHSADPNPSPGLVKLFEQSLQVRNAALEGLTARIDKSTASLEGIRNATIKRDAKTANIGSNGSLTAPSQAARLEALENLRRDIADQLAAFGQLAPEVKIKFNDLTLPPTVGAVGRIYEVGSGKETQRGANTMQVLGPDSALIRLHYVIEAGVKMVGSARPGSGRQVAIPNREDRTAIVMVKGVPTSGVVDGRLFPLPDIYEVNGTETYTTATATNTVMVIRPVDTKTLEPLQAKARDGWEAKLKEPRERAERLNSDAAKLATEMKALVDEETKQAANNASEKAAESKLTLAKALLGDGPTDKAKLRLEQIVKDYPGTKAAGEAQKLLDGMKRP